MFTFSDSWELSTSHCQTRLEELEQQVYFVGGWYFKPELVVLLRLHLNILSNSESLLLADYETLFGGQKKTSWCWAKDLMRCIEKTMSV